MRSSLPRVLVLAAAAFAAACGHDHPTDPGPGAPTAIAIASGNGQTAAVGSPLPNPIAAKVTDANGRGVPGQLVEFRIAAGGGHVLLTSAVTGRDGIATTTWVLGTVAGSLQQVAAHFSDPTTGTASAEILFRATAVAGPAARVIAYSGSGQTGMEHQALAQQLTAMTTDTYGNAVGNVPVTFTVATGGGSVAPTTVTSSAAGLAATTFTLGSFGIAQTVRATALGASVTFSATATRPPEGTSVPLSGRPYALAVSAQDVVYISRLDAASVVRYNGSSTTAADTVDVGSTPTELAFNPSGTKAYVTNQYSNNVGIIDVATGVQTGVIPVSGNPFQVLVSPDGSRLYVTTNENKLLAIDLGTNAIVGQLATGATANGLAQNADGSKLYVSTRAGGSVIEVNTATLAAARTFTPGGTTQAVLVAPDGAELYVVNEDGKLFTYSLATGGLTSTVDLGNGAAFGMALSRDGTKLYVTVMGLGAVQVIDRATHAVVRSYYVAGTPRRIGVTADGTIVVANEQGYVTWLR